MLVYCLFSDCRAPLACAADADSAAPHEGHRKGRAERKRLDARKAEPLRPPDRAESAAARKPVHPEGVPCFLSS